MNARPDSFTAIRLEMKAHRAMGSRIAELDEWADRIAALEASPGCVVVPEAVEADRVLAVEHLKREMEAWTGSEDIRAAIDAVNRLAELAAPKASAPVEGGDMGGDTAFRNWNRSQPTPYVRVGFESVVFDHLRRYYTTPQADPAPPATINPPPIDSRLIGGPAGQMLPLAERIASYASDVEHIGAGVITPDLLNEWSEEHARMVAAKDAEIARLLPYVTAFRREETRADRMGHKVEEMKVAGACLANIAYNLAQDSRMQDHHRNLLDSARKEWDAARDGLAGQEGAGRAPA